MPGVHPCPTLRSRWPRVRHAGRAVEAGFREARLSGMRQFIAPPSRPRDACASYQLVYELRPLTIARGVQKLHPPTQMRGLLPRGAGLLLQIAKGLSAARALESGQTQGESPGTKAIHELLRTGCQLALLMILIGGGQSMAAIS